MIEEIGSFYSIEVDTLRIASVTPNENILKPNWAIDISTSCRI